MRVIAPDMNQPGSKLCWANIGDVVEYVDAPGVFYIVVLDPGWGCPRPSPSGRRTGPIYQNGGLYAQGAAIMLVDTGTGNLCIPRSLSARVFLHKNVELNVGERS